MPSSNKVRKVTSENYPTDSGREGELIFRLVYQQAGCKKPFSRLWLSSMEENAIREGFAHLKPSTEYDALYNAALCRERADWMVGINASRLFSCLYNQPLAVGRVMTPVLAMTVVREAAIAAFVPEKFYTVDLELTSGCTASSRRIPEKAVAEKLMEACRKEMVATIQRITRKEKSENPPPLYDLTTLQRDANRLLGYSAQQTLDYVQSLYEKKLTTYPRTDSCYMGQEIERSDTLFRDTITSLSHDLRTPLATANGYIQLLQEQDLTGEQKEYATIAGERISAVKLLLDQLFEFARIEADELKLNCRNTDIHSVLRDVVASYYGDFEQKKCVPYIVIPNPPAIIWGDPDALTRIFSNVVYNALVHGEGNYQITAAIEEAQTVITIKNASSSIQQEDIPHLFDRFYTTDQSRTKKTTGLGLAIAQRLVTRMGGQIVASLQNGIFAIQVVFPIVNS